MSMKWLPPRMVLTAMVVVTLSTWAMIVSGRAGEERGLLKAEKLPKKESQIQSLLLKRIEDALKKKEIQLTKDGKDALNKQLAKSAKIIMSDIDSKKYSDEKNLEAQKNLILFVNDLIKRGTETKKVNADTIKQSLSSLCPLYPICRRSQWIRRPSLVSSSRATCILC